MHHWTLDYTYIFAFIVIASFKYFRLIVNSIAYYTYRPVPISDDPVYTSKDVTVVIPCLEGDSDELRETIRTCLRNDPFEIIIVTVDLNLEKAKSLAATVSQNEKNISVYSISQANKRHQMCRAVPHIMTEITVFADDDVYWPDTLLPWVLAPFENAKVGAVGTSQRLRREAQPNFWNFLGAAYLLRRNWDIVACNSIDGGVPCLSGRTAAYRTHIIQSELFSHGFTHETWRSYQLNADDDNFLTRWMMNNGWDIQIQKHRECEVQTTLEGNPKFLLQCLRWARSNWRSNIKSLALERTVWSRHLWSTYAVFQTTLTSWSLAYDGLLAWLFWRATENMDSSAKGVARGFVYLWIFLLCRLVKYLEHFVRYPGDLKYIPLIPVFGYFHASFIKLQAMFTLHVTAWGSREGADDNDSFRMIQLPSYGGWSLSAPARATAATGSSPTIKAEFEAAENVGSDAEEASRSDEAPLLPRYADSAYKTKSLFSFSLFDLKSHTAPEKFSYFASAITS